MMLNMLFNIYFYKCRLFNLSCLAQELAILWWSLGLLSLFGIFYNTYGCTVLYSFEAFNLGGGVWIPHRSGVFKF